MSRHGAWAALRQAPHVGLRMLGGRTDAWSTWARGTLVMSTGDYAAATRLLTPLSTADDEVAGLACARLASGLRQVDEHEAAVAWDERAMSGPGQAAIDGWVGRAADAVGMADADLARTFLSQAESSADGLRDHIRIGWVACEIALLQGDVDAAARHAQKSFRLSLVFRSPRHETKSALFWAAALRHSQEEQAMALLRRGIARAQELTLRPFTWPMVMVMGDRATAGDEAAAAAAVAYIAAHLPPDAGDSWLHRPDIASAARMSVR